MTDFYCIVSNDTTQQDLPEGAKVGADVDTGKLVLLGQDRDAAQMRFTTLREEGLVAHFQMYEGVEAAKQAAQAHAEFVDRVTNR